MWASSEADPAAGAAALAADAELFVIANPGAGKHDLHASRRALDDLFAQAGRRHRFVDIGGPGGLAAASARAAAQAAACQGVLVAMGGDGTVGTVAQAAWHAGCPLGVLPQGTFNLFARDHGIPQDLEAAARALLRAEPKPVQVGEVNGRLFLVNASLGLYPQLLEDREAFKQQFGRRRWVAVLSGLLTVFRWRRQLALEIELDGQRTLVRTPTLFVGNNRLQLDRVGVDPAVAARVGEGRLAALVLRPIGSWSLVGLLLRGALGRLGEAGQVNGLAFRSLTVDVLGRRRAKLAADGEVGMMHLPLRFAVAARPLLLMLPRPQDRVPVA